MSSLMAAVYTAISAILLFWHSVWHRVFGDADALSTDWAWVLGIVFLVLTVRIALFPLVVRQVRAQRAVQRLQPRIKELREKHRGDMPALQAEMLKLYQTEKIRPMASLLPLLVQAPILFGLLHVLRHVRPGVTSEASRTLYGWTLTQFDSAVNAELFGAPIAAAFTSSGAASVTVKIVAAVLILIMVVTTYLSTRQMINRSGPAADPQTRIVQRVMLYGFPISLLISGVIFPIGVVLYWVVQNLFALGQQAWILRRYPLTPAPSPSSEARSAVKAPQVGAKPARRRPAAGAPEAGASQAGAESARRRPAAGAPEAGASQAGAESARRRPAAGAPRAEASQAGAESARRRRAAGAPEAGASQTGTQPAGRRPAAEASRAGAKSGRAKRRRT